MKRGKVTDWTLKGLTDVFLKKSGTENKATEARKKIAGYITKNKLIKQYLLKKY